MKKKFLWLIVFTCYSVWANSQITGTVFRDYNGNGTQNVATSSVASVYNEPGIFGVLVKAYSSTDALLYTKTTNVTGQYSFSTSELPSGVTFRLEFTFPTNTACLNKLIDLHSSEGTSASSSYSSVQFVTAGASATANFAINNPEEYNSTTNPVVYVPQYRNGNPLLNTPPYVGAILSKDSSAFLSFAYNSSGLTNSTNNTVLASARKIGTTYGVAYSKPAGLLFTSAVLKRFSGYGPANGNPLMAPGAIYQIKPGVDSGTFFTTLDSSLWGATFYAHNVTASTTDSFRVRANSGTNSRALSHIFEKVNDAWTFHQIGKVGLGGLELSDDGRYLYTVNLYKKSLVRIDLQTPSNPTMPTSSTHFTSYSLPALNTLVSATLAGRGDLRPWALKFYRGKLYVGAVYDAARTPAGNTVANLTAAAVNLRAFVFEFDTTSNTFTTVLNQPLNYPRSTPFSSGTCSGRAGWYPWTNTFFICNSVTNVFPQPMLTDIDFDSEGAMIISFADRAGYQGGVGQPSNTSAVTTVYDTYVSGDILRAYRRSDCVFEFESNAKEGASSPKSATTGASNAQGPTNGEFYVGDGDTDNSSLSFDYHPDNADGAVAYVPGLNHILSTFVDPINAGTNGAAKLHNTNGKLLANNSYQIYDGNVNLGTHHKIHGLGDVEIAKSISPIEIGNRVWYDADADGIQEPGESGLSGVGLTLYTDPDGNGNIDDGIAIASVTSSSTGHYLFSAYNGTSTSDAAYGLDIKPFTNYVIRVNNATCDTFGNFSAHFIGGTGYTVKSLSNIVGNGEPDWTDNDAQIFWKAPNNYANYQVSVTTGRAGTNNHSIDFAFALSPSILNVQQITLQGYVAQQAAKLQWQVNATPSLQYFTLERSVDGQNFQTLQQLNSSTSFYTDNWYSGSAVLFYYRLKATFANGLVAYSNTIMLNKTQQNDIHLITNPVKTDIKLQVKNTVLNQQASITVVSTNGAVLISSTQKLTQGNNLVSIPADNLPKGVYTLQINTSKTKQIFKLLKQ